MPNVNSGGGDMNRRDFLRLWGKWLAGLLITWWLMEVLSCNSTDKVDEELLFDEKYYINLQKTNKELVEKDVLFENMPTAYDNILYAQDIRDHQIMWQNTTIHHTCDRIRWVEENIKNYAAKYGIPYSKLLWLVMLESAGKATAGSKKWCYGWTQLSTLMGKTYGAIVEKKVKGKKGKIKTKIEDHRDEINYALDATCQYLTHLHTLYWDDNRSLSFAAYHMGETHMRNILKKARNINPDIKNLQDLVEINDKELAVELMWLLDESYKYYPKLLAAGRIYDTFKKDRNTFKENIKQYIDMPITRKPSLAEEYPWFWDKQFKDVADMKKAMQDGELFGIKSNDFVENSLWFNKIWEYTKDENELEFMHMTSKAVWWLAVLLMSHCDKKIIINSLTRSTSYNDKIYAAKWQKVKNKRTAHATGMTLDLDIPAKRNDLLYLKYILYTLELQGKISFLEESGTHFHININPKFKEFFESIVE